MLQARAGKLLAGVEEAAAGHARGRLPVGAKFKPGSFRFPGAFELHPAIVDN
jgi:hypothetical protein